MRRWLGMPITAALALTACVTINVYFPAAEAKEAAKEFVEKVIGEEGTTPAPGQDEGKPGGGMALRFDPLMLIGISPAHAQTTPDITIKTPAIQAIQSRMASRFDGTLRKHFDAGALGFSNSGEVSVRDAAKIPLGDRVAVNQAVAEQNRDAKAVYREIAVANNHPEWEAQIRSVFARQWVASARSGWWYQDAGGAWKQK
ncbi:uncharacterized protein DUF1318 [Luteimonas cucumeris]|uniref:Uncharacterized protein DUF1318 n=1 Tax=Luteimonas cucumeris TaxID=985012 RepID=A0A562L777_9GAMM|nr:YdbL family protein [Luteimonas cucumeris]TWI03509.1 uncharacterized protein DUF1318 [Luteimonas cucumeris]